MIPVRDTVPRRCTPVVTWSLIAVNAVVFFYELSLGPDSLERFFYFFGVVPARYTHPEWAHWVGLRMDDYWPFLTSMFLHGGWAHIIGNMWMLWLFGDNVEDRMGRARFLIFYLLTGIAAGMTHALTNPDSTVPALGASGALSGVLGAYFVLFPRARIIAMLPVFFWPFFFELPAVTYLFVWLMSQFFGAALSALAPQSGGGIAFWAHIGGFVAGVAFLRFFLLPRRSAPRGWESDEFGVERAWAR